jgi:hypothetical protein
MCWATFWAIVLQTHPVTLSLINLSRLGAKSFQGDVSQALKSIEDNSCCWHSKPINCNNLLCHWLHYFACIVTSAK